MAREHPPGEELQLGAYNLAPIAITFLRDLAKEGLMENPNWMTAQEITSKKVSDSVLSLEEVERFLAEYGAAQNSWLLLPGEEMVEALGLAGKRVVLAMSHTHSGVKKSIVTIE